MSNLISFIKSKQFLINVGIAFALILILILGLNSVIKSLTNHGETVTVPNVIGLSAEEAKKVLTENNLVFQLSDSIWVDEAKPGAVVEQFPRAEDLVKGNRIVYINVNAVQKPKVKLPDLEDLSLRQAQSVLQTFGLLTGKITYVPDIAMNAVVEMQKKGRVLKPGTLIDKGETIDLVLGMGEGSELVKVPYLIGFTIEEAKRIIETSSLSVGAIVYDNTVKDTINALVYKQLPHENTEEMINSGRSIDIFITEDPKKVKTVTIPE